MNPYKVLGVPIGCTHEEVRGAFLLKVQQVHPDHGGDGPSFVQLRAAYEQILEQLDQYPGLAAKTTVRNADVEHGPTGTDQSAEAVPYPDWVARVSAKMVKCLWQPLT